jgi:Uma2 family endonuclease
MTTLRLQRPDGPTRDERRRAAYAEAMRASARRSAVFYPVVEEKVPEHELQGLIRELLRPMLARFLAERGLVAHAGADQFIYWVEGDPTTCIAPDIYVLPGVSQKRIIPNWKVWEDGIAPSFTMEIVPPKRTAKDYRKSPALHDALGVNELVISDPFTRPGTPSRRVRWQVYRRVRGRGLVRVEVSQGDRVRSKSLGVWLRAVEDGEGIFVRLGMGPEGDELFPTEGEAAAERARAATEQARAATEQARAATEQARAATEQARTATERERSAAAEVERLRALLAKKNNKTRSTRRRTTDG